MRTGSMSISTARDAHNIVYHKITLAAITLVIGGCVFGGPSLAYNTNSEGGQYATTERGKLIDAIVSSLDIKIVGDKPSAHFVLVGVNNRPVSGNVIIEMYKSSDIISLSSKPIDTFTSSVSIINGGTAEGTITPTTLIGLNDVVFVIKTLRDLKRTNIEQGTTRVDHQNTPKTITTPILPPQDDLLPNSHSTKSNDVSKKQKPTTSRKNEEPYSTHGLSLSPFSGGRNDER